MSQRIPTNFAQQFKVTPSPLNPEGGSFILKGLPYFSHVRFTLTRSGAGPAFTYTVPSGVELKAFNYKQGDTMDQAGRPGVIATSCDTNLQEAGKTIAGEDVFITGVGLQIAGVSDGLAAKNLLRDVSFKISLDGGDRANQLGNCEMLPGMSGLYASASGIAPSSGGLVGTVSNGLPEISNYFPIRGGLRWARAGQTDSNLVVILKTERAVTFDVSNATAPATIFVDLRVQLVSAQGSAPSVNL